MVNLKRRRYVALLGPLDQAASSLTNFVVPMAVASRGTIADFAAISTAMLITTLGLGVLRSISGDVLISRGMVPEPASRQNFVSAVPRLVSSFVFAALFLLIALNLVFHFKVVALEVGVIGLMAVGIQDALRYLAFADGRGEVALASDAIWLVGVAAMVVVAHWQHWAWAYAIWAASSLPASITAWIMLRRPIPVGNLRTWLKDTWPAGRSFLTEYLSVGGAATAGLLLLAASAAAPVVAAVRGVQFLAMPLGVLVAGGAMTLPRALAAKLTSETRNQAFWKSLAAITVTSIIGSLCLVLIPRAVGERLLGASWAKISPVRLWLPIYVTASAIGMLARTTVRLLHAEMRTARRQLAVAPMCLLGPALGAKFGGASGAMGAIASTTIAVAAVWFWEARQHFRVGADT
jgi:hypothetical protein